MNLKDDPSVIAHYITLGVPSGHLMGGVGLGHRRKVTRRLWPISRTRRAAEAVLHRSWVVRAATRLLEADEHDIHTQVYEQAAVLSPIELINYPGTGWSRWSTSAAKGNDQDETQQKSGHSGIPILRGPSPVD